MVNISKLRGRIIEKYGTIGNFANTLKKPISYVSRIINGNKDMTTKEIGVWSRLLQIESDEIVLYFFADLVNF